MTVIKILPHLLHLPFFFLLIFLLECFKAIPRHHTISSLPTFEYKEHNKRSLKNKVERPVSVLCQAWKDFLHRIPQKWWCLPLLDCCQRRGTHYLTHLLLCLSGLELGFPEGINTTALSLCCLRGTQDWARAAQRHRERAQLIRVCSFGKQAQKHNNTFT